MTHKITIQIMMMICVFMIRAMNSAIKITIDAIEMVFEMSGIIRKNKNTKNIINMLMGVLIMKIIDSMISNKMSFAIDVMKIVAKGLNFSEMTEGLTLMLILITAMIISAIGKIKFVGETSVITYGSIAVSSVTIASAGTTGNVLDEKISGRSQALFIIDQPRRMPLICGGILFT